MKSLILLASLFFTVQAHASELASTEEAKLLVKNVMTLVGNGDTNKGLQLLKPFLIIPESEFDVMLNNLKLQQPMIDQRFGKTVGVENMGEKIVGNSFMRIAYAQKFEKHAMRWNFYFYKPKSGWVLNTFNTDDKLQLLFSE